MKRGEKTRSKGTKRTRARPTCTASRDSKSATNAYFVSVGMIPTPPPRMTSAISSRRQSSEASGSTVANSVFDCDGAREVMGILLNRAGVRRRGFRATAVGSTARPPPRRGGGGRRGASGICAAHRDRGTAAAAAAAAASAASPFLPSLRARDVRRRVAAGVPKHVRGVPDDDRASSDGRRRRRRRRRRRGRDARAARARGGAGARATTARKRPRARWRRPRARHDVRAGWTARARRRRKSTQQDNSAVLARTQ